MKDIGQRQSRFVAGLFLIVFVAALFLFWRMVAVYLTPLVLALVLASLFWSVFEKLNERIGGRRPLAASLTTALVVLVVVVPFALVLTSLSAEAFALYEKTSSDEELLRQFRGLLSGESALAKELREQAARVNVDLSPQKLSEHAATLGKSVGLFLYEQIGGIAQNALSLLLHFGMMLLFLYVFFSEGPRLKAFLLDLSPLPDEEEEMVAERFKALARAVFLGNGVASALQGVMGGISFYLFGIGSGILWGAAIAFFAFLPMVGASVVLLPAAAYLFLQGNVSVAVGFLLFNAVQVAVLEYVVKTRLMAGKGPDQLNAVVVFFGIVAGITVFGLMGLFYGPLVIAIVLTLADIYKAHYRDTLLKVVRLDVAIGPEPDVDALAPPPQAVPSSPAAAPAEPLKITTTSEREKTVEPA